MKADVRFFVCNSATASDVAIVFVVVVDGQTVSSTSHDPGDHSPRRRPWWWPWWRHDDVIVVVCGDPGAGTCWPRRRVRQPGDGGRRRSAGDRVLSGTEDGAARRSLAQQVHGTTSRFAFV